ncbi:hypothetical protein CQ10_02870 [Bradyrhizobium valentinum]|uniref:Uncharacterized protein n=2 Tax=Bradyrhizobium valentinum TaxID=1518501 RepID=A0A0R3KYN3_9BRAD|nr:hypothetical protein CQ10_02870 [Bradyrhizobium valentinum]KRR10982.1 hypothetical protein CP49_33635 [Bradyrhizobium valentinum]
MAVTGFTIHDNVITPRFPSPIFCSKAFKFQRKRQRVGWIKLTKMVVIFPLVQRCANDFDME